MTTGRLRARMLRHLDARGTLMAVLPYAAFLVIGVVFFLSVGRDDVYITFWAARSLAERGEILNYSGARVEQSSSLLHVVLLAAAARLSRANLVNLGHVVSIAAGLLAVWLSGRIANRLDVNKRHVQLLLATATPFVYWSFSGMETSLVAACLAGLVLAYLRVRETGSLLAWSGFGAALSCYLLVRPESIFVVAAFLAFLIAVRGAAREGIRTELAASALAAVLFLALATWRSVYFHDLFPQPVAAKIGSPGTVLGGLRGGFNYLLDSGRQYPVWFVFYLFPVGVAISFIRREWPDDRRAVVIALAAAYLGFVLTAGGDWMEGGRLIAPALPLLVACFLVSWRRIVAPAVVAAVACANIVAVPWFAHAFSSGSVLGDSSFHLARPVAVPDASALEWRCRVHYRDLLFLDRALPLVKRYLDAFPGRRLNLMSIQAGMINYYLFANYGERLRFVDAVGLTSRELTDCGLAGQWKRTPVGRVFTYEVYLARRDEFLRECGVPVPDIIFDMDGHTSARQELVARFGYRTVYRQGGVLWGAQPFHGMGVTTDQFLAVSDELYRALPLETATLAIPRRQRSFWQ